MSGDLLLAIAGTLIFSITTVATLWFGYSRFFEWYELSPDGTAPVETDPAAAAPVPAPVAPAPALAAGI